MAKFIDLFAGIGGFRLGMESAGHECVGFCEIDEHAVRSYTAMHDTKGEWFSNDITTVEPGDMPDFEILTGGFPCQSFSIAGKRGGFEDTRGTLFFEIARIIQERQPQLIFLENVRGLLSHDEGQTFGTILNTFWELGYDAEWQLLNSKDFGVPQNRERIFIIAYPRGRSGGQIFPIRGISQTASIKIIGTTADGKAEGTNSRQWVHDTTGIVGALGAGEHKQPKQIIQLNNPTHSNNRLYSEKGISPTLNCMEGGNRQPFIQIKEATIQNMRIRKLTPRECFRLQSFPDELFEKAREVNSDSQLYKQAGNSVTVNVIYEIAKRIKELMA